MNKPRWVTKIIHKLILKYLVSCGGAFHSNPYGQYGLYVVMMNEKMYGECMESIHK